MSGLPASELLYGLASMQKSPGMAFRICAGDMVRVRVAIPGGCVWKSGRVVASYPSEFGRRTFDVSVDTGVLRGVSEFSLRAMATV